MRQRALLTLAALAAGVLLIPAPAQAASRVSVSNDQGSAKADPTYATTLTVKGSGFQSIKGGHGGIYVFFGTVNGAWQPSKGGQVGTNYSYVPDSESKNNQGFQRFVAFPGSDTANAANGGTIKADGTWSTEMTVPGATFNTVDRAGKAVAVDCLKTTCGIITIGAHGVKNGSNETFTPVSFADLYSDQAPKPTTSSAAPKSGGISAAPTAAGAPAAPAAPAAPEPTTTAPVATAPILTIDQATAVAGRVMTFNAVGLPPGDQVVASFDDGVAAVGPLNVGPNGQVAGAIQLPAHTRAGTHTLKISGTASNPTVNFPVSAPVEPAAAASQEAGTSWIPIAFAGLALVALMGALTFSIVRVRSLRQKAVPDAV